MGGTGERKAGRAGRAHKRAHGRAANDVGTDAEFLKRLNDADVRPAARGTASQSQTYFHEAAFSPQRGDVGGDARRTAPASQTEALPLH